MLTARNTCFVSKLTQLSSGVPVGALAGMSLGQLRVTGGRSVLSDGSRQEGPGSQRRPGRTRGAPGDTGVPSEAVFSG